MSKTFKLSSEGISELGAYTDPGSWPVVLTRHAPSSALTPAQQAEGPWTGARWTFHAEEDVSGEWSDGQRGTQKITLNIETDHFDCLEADVKSGKYDTLLLTHTRNNRAASLEKTLMALRVWEKMITLGLADQDPAEWEDSDGKSVEVYKLKEVEGYLHSPRTDEVKEGEGWTEGEYTHFTVRICKERPVIAPSEDQGESGESGESAGVQEEGK